MTALKSAQDLFYRAREQDKQPTHWVFGPKAGRRFMQELEGRTTQDLSRGTQILLGIKISVSPYIPENKIMLMAGEELVGIINLEPN